VLDQHPESRGPKPGGQFTFARPAYISLKQAIRFYDFTKSSIAYGTTKKAGKPALYIIGCNAP
jgi:hypothetical protein